MNRWLRHSVAVALLAGLFVPFGTATAADMPGTFHVFDDAGIFSTDGKKQATKKLEGQKFDRGLHDEMLDPAPPVVGNDLQTAGVLRPLDAVHEFVAQRGGDAFGGHRAAVAAPLA